MPRSGGLGIAAAVLFGFIAVAWVNKTWHSLGFFIVGAALVGGASYFDDRRSLTAGIKIAIHTLAAIILVSAQLAIIRLSLPGWSWEWAMWLGNLMTLLYIIWMINLYNFMDGMDGFAAGMAIIGFTGCALLGVRAGDLFSPGFAWSSRRPVAAFYGSIFHPPGFSWEIPAHPCWVLPPPG